MIRKRMSCSKIEFDKAINQMIRNGKLFGHRHVYPAQAKSAGILDQLTPLSDYPDEYLVGVVIRNAD